MKLNDDEGNIGIITEERIIEKLKQEITDLDIDRANLFKIVDKLEQRIATLEKVLQSHAKCIGEMREGKSKDAFINLMEKGERG